MNVEETIQYLEGRMTDNPRSLLFARLADLYLRTGRIDEAITLCTEGIKTYPGYVTGYFIKGKAYLAKGDRDQAESAFKNVLTHDQQYLAAHKQLGDLMTRSGWETKAAANYKDILRIDPLEEEARQMLETFQFTEDFENETPLPQKLSEKEDTTPIVETTRMKDLTFNTEDAEPESIDDILTDESTEEPVTLDENLDSELETSFTGRQDKDLSKDDLDINPLQQTEPAAKLEDIVIKDEEKNWVEELEEVFNEESRDLTRKQIKPAANKDEAASVDLDSSDLDDVLMPDAPTEEISEDEPPPIDALEISAEEELESGKEESDDIAADLESESDLNEAIEEAATPLVASDDSEAILESDITDTKDEETPLLFQDDVTPEKVEDISPVVQTAPADETPIESDAPWDIPEEVKEQSSLKEETPALPDEKSVESKPQATEPSKESETGKIVSPTLGEIYAAQGQFAKAIRVYETLLEKNPQNKTYKNKIEDLKKKQNK